MKDLWVLQLLWMLIQMSNFLCYFFINLIITGYIFLANSYISPSSLSFDFQSFFHLWWLNFSFFLSLSCFLFVCLSVSLSVCLSVCLSLFLPSLSLSHVDCLSVCLSLILLSVLSFSINFLHFVCLSVSLSALLCVSRNPRSPCQPDSPAPLSRRWLLYLTKPPTLRLFVKATRIQKVEFCLKYAIFLLSDIIHWNL